MPSLTPEDRFELLGPDNRLCGMCMARVYRSYCRQCDEFYFDCYCANNHELHRVYRGRPLVMSVIKDVRILYVTEEEWERIRKLENRVIRRDEKQLFEYVSRNVYAPIPDNAVGWYLPSEEELPEMMPEGPGDGGISHLVVIDPFMALIQKMR
jgi:hypothetical protein